MSLYIALALGALQGLTEFLPVSSSGHLVIFGDVLGGSPPPRAYDVAVHVGTLVAVCAFYRRELGPLAGGVVRLLVAVASRTAGNVFKGDQWARLAGLLVAACVPTALIGVGLDLMFEDLFNNSGLAAVALLVTGAFLTATDCRLRQAEGQGDVQDTGLSRALLIGIAQGIAILPGISRSGAVLCTGVWVGLSREFALRFAFLLSIPAVLSAAGYELVGLANEGFVAQAGVSLGAHLSGALAAAVFGYLAIAWLLRATRSGRLWMFGAYCLVAGIVGLGVALG